MGNMYYGIHELTAVFPAYCQYCRQLDHDIENLGFVVIEIQQVTDDNQVTSTADRQELGRPLNQALNKRF
jgi:hypothetical protein